TMDDRYPHLSRSPGPAPKRLNDGVAKFSGRPGTIIEPGFPKFEENHIRTSAQASFSPVTPAVWAFRVGGYQVCEKWLKDRRGRPLTNPLINHYLKTLAALEATVGIMAELDEIVSTSGGWESAFVG